MPLKDSRKIGLELSQEEFREFKLETVKSGKYMSEVLRELVKQWIKSGSHLFSTKTLTQSMLTEELEQLVRDGHLKKRRGGYFLQ